MTINVNLPVSPEPVDRFDADRDAETLTAHRSSLTALAREERTAWIAPLAIAAGDVAVFLGGIFAATEVWDVGPNGARFLCLVASVAILAFASVGLYPGYRLHGDERLRRRVLATLAVALGAGLGTWLLTGTLGGVLAAELMLLSGLVLQPVVGAGIARLLHGAGVWGETAVIFGAPEEADYVTDAFRQEWRYGIRPQPGGGFGREARLALIAGGRQVDLAEIERLRARFDEVVLLADLPDRRLVGLCPSEIGGRVGITLAGRRPRTRRAVASRLADLAIAVPALLAALPLILVGALAVKWIDPGPAFYRQSRIGRDRQTFPLLKLRTMYRDADIRLAAVLQADPVARDEWETHFKLRHDPRILPVVGHVLRATSIDELPQLLNVLGGDMRIVGPRPLPDYHLNALDAAFQTRRCSVTPGLTGLWQVSGRSTANQARLEAIDDFYLSNRSLWLDLAILLRTASAVLRGRGAY